MSVEATSRPGAEAGTAPPPAEPSAEPSAVEARRSAWTWIRFAAITLSIYAGYQLLVVLEGVLSTFFKVVLYLTFGGILALIVEPVVELLSRSLRIPRTAAILVALFGGLALLGGLIYLAAGPTISEAHNLANQVPALIDRANNELQTLRDQLKGKGVDTSSLNLSSGGDSLGNRLSSVLLTTVSGTLNFVVDLVIVFVVAFWLLKDGDRLRAGLLSLMPGKLREEIAFALDATGVVIGGYVRAQLFLAVVIGLMGGVGCAILGVPFPIVVAIAAGIFELIPIVGPFVGGAVGILLALTVGVNLALETLVLFIFIHILEGYVLGPRIQAKFVRLHPLVSLLALFAGIDIGGFLGALFAVPLASLAAVFIRATVGEYRAHRPELYASRRVDLYTERRRQSILHEFRLFKSSPKVMVRGWLRREPPVADPVAGATAPVQAAAVGGIEVSVHEARIEQDMRGQTDVPEADSPAGR